jgi:molybdenum cofactor cytidylyltransferase
MGEPKQLMSLGDKTLIRHAIEVGLASQCRPIVVVLGAAAEKIQPTLEGLPIETAINPRWSEGMGTSIATGIAVAAKHGSTAAILSLADQPLVSPTILNHLIEQQSATGKPIVASEYGGSVGVPVLFTQEFFPNLIGLQPAQGCKGVILGHPGSAVHIPCPEAEFDVDTPEDYQRCCAAIATRA